MNDTTTQTGVMCANCKQHHPTVADVRACHEATFEGHAEQQAELATEQRYERWLEDGGEHHAAIQADLENDAAHEWQAPDWGADGYSDAPVVLTMEPAATQRQMDYLAVLWRERGETPATTLSKTEASAEIKRLLGLPKVPSPDPKNDLSPVPAGRYAVRDDDGITKFYKVDKPTEGHWAGRTFISVQASDDFHPVKGRAALAVLDAIEGAGIQQSMLLYGREIGSCGHCGRTLTNEESRAAGIGPICRGKMGW